MLEVFLLGKFEVTRDNALIEIPSRPTQSLLACLILDARKSFRREKLAGLLWPDSSETNARRNLRQALWRLRKAISENYFRTNKVSVGFNPEAEYTLDVDTLREEIDGSASAERLMRIVSVYGGSLLPGFYQEWVVPIQAQMQGLFEDRVAMLIERLIDAARWRETRQWAELWIARGSAPESAYRALMMAATGREDLAGVFAVYQRCCKALVDDVGVEPSGETRELLQRLRNGEPLPGGKIKHAHPGSFMNLPVPPTPFIGRSEEFARISALLADPRVALITLLGPGGIGKTRVAIEAAKSQQDSFAHGVCFVALAPVNDPQLIVSQIADAVGFSFHVRDRQATCTPESQNNQLLAFLRPKRILLVLDNLDHLLRPLPPDPDAGLPGPADLITDIMRMAPRVKILATSRERINLQAETGFVLKGLGYPEPSQPAAPEDMQAYDAVRLFVDSAQRVQPGFALAADNLSDVIEICRRVDGMPLALELAAAWISMLAPAEIAEEIRNSPDFLESDLHDIQDRHRSIRTVFDHTWKRLAPNRQKVFRQLSIFRGGFTRRAAREVAGASLRDLKALLDQSLIRWEFGGRYQIHELLRQFGTEQLAGLPAEETAANDRHCGYYATFMKERQTDLMGRNQARALSEIEVDIDNVRAAWQWAVANSKLAEIDQTMESLAEFYRVRGGLAEVAGIFDRAALKLGWVENPTLKVPGGGGEIFRNIMQRFDTAGAITQCGNETEFIVGKLLARSNRFY